MSWNHCEIQARQILKLLLGDDDPALAITAEIQNRSLSNAIRACAVLKRFAKQREHLEHFVTGYDKLLAYRNYYTHALISMKDDYGELLSISAKGRLGTFADKITSDEINDLQGHMQRLLGYGAAIRKDMGDKGGALDEVISALSASLEKPQWPPSLKKFPNYMLET